MHHLLFIGSTARFAKSYRSDHGRLCSVTVTLHQSLILAGSFYRKTLILVIIMTTHHDLTVNGACNSISGITERFMRVRTSFGPGSFRPGRFGQFLGWVVLALVGGSFRPIFGVSCFGPGSFRPNSIETNKV